MDITLQTGIRFLSGRVEKEKQLTKTIEFPTVNVKVATELLPTEGVYGVYIYRGNRQYVGVMHVGKHETIELHILDCQESIFDEILVIEILFPIRKETELSNLSTLTEQLKKDVVFVKKAVKQIQNCNVAI